MATGISMALTMLLIWMVLIERFYPVCVLSMISLYALAICYHILEDYNLRKRAFLVIGALILTVLLVLSVPILDHELEVNLSISAILGLLSILLMVIILYMFMPFLAWKDDTGAWCHMGDTLMSLMLSFLSGGITAAGALGLTAFADYLFDLDISYKVYLVLTAILLCQVPLFLFLGSIPTLQQIKERPAPRKGFMVSVSKWLFIPLELCYMGVLYAYLLKIILAWELPDGMVSYLVSIMAFGLILIRILLYPYLWRKEMGFERTICKILPYLSLPLLALMSIGIVRRLSDYGITVNRLYILTLNLWFYGVMIHMVLKGNNRFRAYPLSLAALLLLTTALPWNFFTLTGHVMRNDIKKALERYPQYSSLPMSGEEFLNWTESLPRPLGLKVRSEVSYLRAYISPDECLEWVQKDTPGYGVNLSLRSDKGLIVPPGSIRAITVSGGIDAKDIQRADDGSLRIDLQVPVSDLDGEVKLRTAILSIQDWGLYPQDGISAPVEATDKIIVLSSIDIWDSQGLPWGSYEGILFTKAQE